MIFIGAQSCDYQSFGQIYVRQLGESCILVAEECPKCPNLWTESLSEEPLRFYYHPGQIITHGNRRRLITMIG